MSTLDSIKSELQKLVTDANATTGGNAVTVREGVDALIGGFGQGGSGGASLNIHYGDTEPSDTSMLWCKCDEPSGVLVSPNMPSGDSENTINLFSNMVLGMAKFDTASIGSNIYVLGGIYGGTNATIYKTDITNGESSIVTHLSTGKYGVGASGIGTRIYMFGGEYYQNSWKKSAEIIKFDTQTKANTVLSTALSVGKRYLNVICVGTNIYIFGGQTSSAHSDVIEIFDTETETISTSSVALPYGMSCIGSVAIGTKIYLFGGYNNNQYFDIIQVFDTETETLTALPVVLPTTLAGMGVGAIGNKIYLFGGQIDSNTYSNAIYMFDTETDSISTSLIALPNSIGYMGVETIENEIYILGGTDASKTYYDTIFKVESETIVNLENGKAWVYSNSSENLFDILNGNVAMQIGVTKVYKGNSDNKGEVVDSYLYKDGAWSPI